MSEKLFRIKELLKEKGMSGKELADAVGISETSVSGIVSGRQSPKMDTVVSIAGALNVEVWELFVESRGDNMQPIFTKDESGQFVEIGSIKKQ